MEVMPYEIFSQNLYKKMSTQLHYVDAEAFAV